MTLMRLIAIKYFKRLTALLPIKVQPFLLCGPVWKPAIQDNESFQSQAVIA